MWFVPLGVLAGSLAITWLSWRNSSEEARTFLDAHFKFRVREAQTRIEQRMDAYEQVLRGAVGLFAASASVDRDDFRAYAEALGLQEHYPGIQGIGYVLIVPAAGRERHVAATRAEGLPRCEVRPPGERPLYTPVVYLEPFSGRNVRAIGYDMYSEPVRRTAMERARDEGTSAVTGKVKLVQETDEKVQAGFLMVLPISKNGILARSVDERRASILGWVYAPFRMDDLMVGILGEREEDIAIEIFDGETPSPQTRMTAPARAPAAAPAASAFTAVRLLEIAGRPWTLVVRSLPPLDARRDGERPRFIAAAGVGASVFLAFVAWLLARDKARFVRSAQAVRAAREELEAANERLRGANEELAELAGHDRLTGAWNRHQFETAILLEMERTRRSGRPLSLVLLDIDHFKAVNDRLGHRSRTRRSVPARSGRGTAETRPAEGTATPGPAGMPRTGGRGGIGRGIGSLISGGSGGSSVEGQGGVRRAWGCGAAPLLRRRTPRAEGCRSILTLARGETPCRARQHAIAARCHRPPGARGQASATPARSVFEKSAPT